MKTIQTIFALAIVVATFSCTKSDSTTNSSSSTSDLTTINTSVIPNSPYKITTSIPTDTIIVGWNPMYIKIVDTTTNTAVTNATIVMDPLMTEAGESHRHSGPTEQPIYTSSSNAFVGGFIPLHGFSYYADTDSGFTGWKMRYSVTINSKTYDTTKFNFVTKTVKTNTKFFTRVAGNDGNTYCLGLVSPQQKDQVTGLQNIEVVFYKSIKNLQFVPLTDLTIGSFAPTMPDMGHGSSNNVTPTATSLGHYVGKVNFSMGGHWVLSFKNITQNGTTIIDSTGLDVAF